MTTLKTPKPEHEAIEVIRSFLNDGHLVVEYAGRRLHLKAIHPSGVQLHTAIYINIGTYGTWVAYGRKAIRNTLDAVQRGLAPDEALKVPYYHPIVKATSRNRDQDHFIGKVQSVTPANDEGWFSVKCEGGVALLYNPTSYEIPIGAGVFADKGEPATANISMLSGPGPHFFSLETTGLVSMR